MKKSLTALLIGLVIVSSSCSYQTCATYAKAPVEKPSQEIQDDTRSDRAM